MADKRLFWTTHFVIIILLIGVVPFVQGESSTDESFVGESSVVEDVPCDSSFSEDCVMNEIEIKEKIKTP